MKTVTIATWFTGIFFVIALVGSIYAGIVQRAPDDQIVGRVITILAIGVPAMVALVKADQASTTATDTAERVNDVAKAVDGHTSQLLTQTARVTSLAETLAKKE